MNVLPAATLLPAAARSRLRRRAVRRSELAIGVRPEAVRSRADGVPATVAAVEYLGADTLIETTARRSSLHRAAGRPRRTPRAGETVHSAGTPAAAHWFDLSSQCRIDR